ncbi:hypothetical protein Q3G72_013756 [Acer saccharum]|nr:hypothetical protein Q3G72_013756 [Acer saccharum]
MVEVAEVENPEFKWGKKRGIGGKKKDVQFYGSFTYDGVEYNLYDCVYMYKEDEAEPYIGKLIKIWEHSDKTKRVKVLWFFRPCELASFLGNDQALENELFLACGEGAGLVNINPLEAIAGKCNVICISKDSRNPQPSNEELQMSDFVFYRTFDVGHRQILDKMGEKVAGIEVKFLFNQVEHKESSGVVKLDSNKEGGMIAVVGDGRVNSSKDVLEEHKTSKTEDNSIGASVKENVKALLAEQKSLLVKESTSSIKSEQSEFNEVAKNTDRLEKISSDKSSLRLKVEENADSEGLPLGQTSSLREKVDSQVTVSLGDKVRPDDRQEKVSSDRTASSSKVNSEKREGKGVQVPSSKYKVKEELRSTKDPSELDDRPSKRVKLDGSAVVFDDNNKNIVRKLAIAKESHGIEKGSPKRPNEDEKPVKLSNDKFSRESAIKASNINYQVLEVTRRPNSESLDDRSTWFNDTWEERMQGADVQGRLVLLENLDPSCTSADVEDIIWHAFEESCSAKMVQRNAISSPHSGQAYAIFKKEAVAEMVIAKLDEGCLLLSNGRPLIGSKQAPCSTKKQSTFVGHIIIEKLKFQVPRDMREALSTSHCSQPNTLEYDMAMEWFLQQERSDRALKALYKRQGEELRRLKAKLKVFPSHRQISIPKMDGMYTINSSRSWFLLNDEEAKVL